MHTDCTYQIIKFFLIFMIILLFFMLIFYIIFDGRKITTITGAPDGIGFYYFKDGETDPTEYTSALTTAPTSSDVSYSHQKTAAPTFSILTNPSGSFTSDDGLNTYFATMFEDGYGYLWIKVSSDMEIPCTPRPVTAFVYNPTKDTTKIYYLLGGNYTSMYRLGKANKGDMKVIKIVFGTYGATDTKEAISFTENFN